MRCIYADTKLLKKFEQHKNLRLFNTYYLFWVQKYKQKYSYTLQNVKNKWTDYENKKKMCNFAVENENRRNNRYIKIGYQTGNKDVGMVAKTDVANLTRCAVVTVLWCH